MTPSINRGTSIQKSAESAGILRWIFLRGTRALTCEVRVFGKTYDVSVVPHWDVSSSVIEDEPSLQKFLRVTLSTQDYKVIEADKTVRRLKAQQPFIAPSDGWFVPDARWLELRNALSDKIESLEKPK